MKQENIDKLLRFVGEVAGAQPMQPKSYEAEKLLLAIGQWQWIHPCVLCGNRPTVFNRATEEYVCNPLSTCEGNKEEEDV